jgi:hypothetical protein
LLKGILGNKISYPDGKKHPRKLSFLSAILAFFVAFEPNFCLFRLDPLQDAKPARDAQERQSNRIPKSSRRSFDSLRSLRMTGQFGAQDDNQLFIAEDDSACV